MSDLSPLQEAVLEIIKNEVENTKKLFFDGKCELSTNEFVVLLKRKKLEPHPNSIGDAIGALCKKNQIKKITKCYPTRGWVRTITLA